MCILPGRISPSKQRSFKETSYGYIGALNWGLVGLFQFDLVASLFGGMSGTFARIIYTLVGLAGVWGISLLFRRDGIRHHDDSAD